MIIAVTSGAVYAKGLVTDLDETESSGADSSAYSTMTSNSRVELASIGVMSCDMKVKNVDLIKGDDNSLLAKISLVNASTSTEFGSQSEEKVTSIGNNIFNLVENKIQLINTNKICSEFKMPTGAMFGATWITDDGNCKFSFKTEISQKIEDGKSNASCVLKLFVE